jgi:Caspase domain
MKRRHFLQFTSATLTTLGLSQIDFRHQADRYDRALAASPNAQKLALLIGINDYPEGIPDLQGCITDIELQHELLVHRYGFSPDNIRILAAQKLQSSTQTEIIHPTDENIIDQIEKHLIQRAQPGDQVVIHFSGHGAQLPDPQSRTDTLYTIVPTLPHANRNTKTPTIQIISGKTLFLLRELINTDNITLILDSCYSGGALRGHDIGLRYARPDLSSIQLSADSDQKRQTKLIERIQKKQPEWKLEQARPNAKGILLGAVTEKQRANDSAYNDGNNGKFYAGAFSYLLTQYLWQITGQRPLESIQQDIENTYQVNNSDIKPAIEGRDRNRPIYFQAPIGSAADAVIRAVSPDGTVDYWLGGQSPFSLQASRPKTIWTVLDRNGKAVGEIKQQSRQGLTAKGKIIKTTTPNTTITAGMRLQQRIRLIPTNLKLYVGKDPQLDLSNPQAAQLWQEIINLSNIQEADNNNPADCVFGQLTQELRNQQTEDDRQELRTIKDGTLGLLTAPSYRLLTDTFTTDTTDIITRLKHLVAVKFFKQMLKSQSLWEADPASISDHNASKNEKLISAIVPLGENDQWKTSSRFKSQGKITKDPGELQGDGIQINVRNETGKSLYIISITISTNGQLSILYPQTSLVPLESRTDLTRGQLNDRNNREKGYPIVGNGSVEIFVLGIENATEAADLLKELRTWTELRGETAIDPNPNGEQAIAFARGFLRSLNNTTRNGRSIDSQDDAIDLKTFLRASHRITIDP